MAPVAPRPDRCRIAVFAKAPVAGTVKTRLAGLLGDDGAAALQARLVRHTLASAVESAVGAVDLWCAPNVDHDFFAHCSRDYGVALRPQAGGDLGARIGEAFGLAHARGESLLVIGTDCPALTPRVLADAARELRSHDAVVQPAEDGGYVLIGLSRPVAGLFDAVAWGGDTVMSETRHRLRAAAADWHELAVSWDVDRPDDYLRLCREGLVAGVAS